MVWQSQCFCSSQKPRPSLDQSVTRHVFFVLSKMFTPLHISSKISLRLLEQFLQIVIPVKRCLGLEQGAERRHSLSHAECVCYLVDQAEPASNISYVLMFREAPDCTEVLLAVTCYLESREYNSVCSEYELLWVESNAAPATQV